MLEPVNADRAEDPGVVDPARTETQDGEFR